ncbi:MAG: NUDIX domain-containing protein, partial [Dehalococcoidia bacterium]
AAAREVREETTIVVELDDLRLIHTMHAFANDGERVNFFFAPTDWTGEPANAEPAKCDDLSWFPIDQLPSNTVPYVRPAFANFRATVPYSEFGWQR